MKKNPNLETVKVKCVDFTFDGQGVCKHNGRTIFVPSLLKGEEAEVSILYRKKDFDIGVISKILKFSEFRCTPKCKCATACGGCCFQNLEYSKELEYKRGVAVDTIKRIANIDASKAEIFGMKEPYYYRNKVQVPFGYDKRRRLVYGFYRFKSHDIVPISECVIEDKAHVKILSTIARLMKELDIKAYNEDTRKGDIRHILLRVGKVSKEVMVVIIATSNKFKNKNTLSKALVKTCPEITTVVLNVNDRKTNVILGEREEILYGKGFIEDELLGVKFRISPKSFYQVNHDQCEVLYSLAFKEADLQKTDVLLDAYCGIGTIGLTASKKVKEVIGVEIVSDAIKDAKLNAKINNIHNAKYFCMDASEFVFNNKFDCVIVDPPRKGLDEKFLNSLIKSAPKKLVYISCDVGTLARDLKILKEYFDIKSINFVDMFPRTFHVETVVSLTKKNLKTQKPRKN